MKQHFFLQHIIEHIFKFYVELVTFIFSWVLLEGREKPVEELLLQTQNEAVDTSLSPWAGPLCTQAPCDPTL